MLGLLPYHYKINLIEWVWVLVQTEGKDVKLVLKALHNITNKIKYYRQLEKMS